MSNEYDNTWKNRKMLNDVRKGQILNYSQYIYKKFLQIAKWRNELAQIQEIMLLFQNWGVSLRSCCSFTVSSKKKTYSKNIEWKENPKPYICAVVR